MRSQQFAVYLTVAAWRATGETLPRQALDDALRRAEAQAIADGETYETSRRVAEHDGRLYLDLGGADRRCVEISAVSWRVVAPPREVKFLRSPGMRSLPVPEHSEDGIATLAPFIADGDDTTLRLVVAFMVAALRPRGPYPILIITGEQGSAKSTSAEMVRRLVDPSAAPLRSLPRDERDLVVSAHNSHVLAFDNVSALPAWLADALCRLSTGGGFATRELHTNQEEVLFFGQRPVILNGISELTGRPDLHDRALVAHFPRIAESRRRAVAEIWSEFDAAAPRILGAILDGLRSAVAHLSETRLADLPRMADLALWIEAASPGLGWERGAFLELYRDNRRASSEAALAESDLAQAIARLVEVSDGNRWEGIATSLYTRLGDLVTNAVQKGHSWPRDAARLAGALRRLAPPLRAAGISIEFTKAPDRSRARLVVIRRLDPTAAPE